jgi:hypothetical protein
MLEMLYIYHYPQLMGIHLFRHFIDGSLLLIGLVLNRLEIIV